MAKKVICAMSGGLDSSVAATLLKRAGFNVVGVFMKLWTVPEKDGLVGTRNKCCSPEAEIRARKVAEILKIPFYVFNFEKEFKKRIVDYFLREYKKGNTPNPCVVCNKEIKFGLLLEKALKLDADYIATGHYAQKIQNPKCKNQNDNSKCKNFKLLRAKDKNKDQSYFLWQLKQKQLRYILFPIGNYTKSEVKKLAKKMKLPVTNIPESQEICFVGKIINDFLKRYLKEKPGQIVDSDGKVLGRHQGLWFYTIGQRQGIGLPGGPFYVLNKNLKKNTLIVTKNEKDLYSKELIAKNVNWISSKHLTLLVKNKLFHTKKTGATEQAGKEPKLSLRVMAKIRYCHQPTSATITKIINSKFYILKFDKPQRAITPGQSVVFYSPSKISQRKTWEDKSQELLGGGIICCIGN